MFKKICCIIIAVIMMFTICACGADNTTDEVKIGLICLHDSNSPYDNNFIEAFEAACEAKGVTGVIKTNVGENNEAYEASAELADSGCSAVFGDSFGFEDYMIQAAEEFTDVEFCHATGTKAHTANLSNFHNAFASIYEGRYLDGIALGLKLNEMIDNGIITADEAVVGYVGAYPYAEVISGYTAFYLGVKEVCSSATMKVAYTYSWYDETMEKEAAIKLIEDGCVVMSSHADSMGVPTACESNNIPFVFYNGSVEDACPNTFIVSTKINWQPYFEYMIDCILNDTEIATDWVGTMQDSSVIMTNINVNVCATDTETIMQEYADKLINKEISVFDIDNFTVNGEHITSYMADVDFDANYEVDTELVVDGVVQESVFRSAPAFALIIDGITILGE